MSSEIRPPKQARKYKRDVFRMYFLNILSLVWHTCFISAVVYMESRLPDLIGDTNFAFYLGSIRSALALAGIAEVARIIRSLAVILSGRRIVNGSFYTVMVTRKEQKRIYREMASQSILEHFSVFEVVLTFVSIPLTAAYLLDGDDSYLLFGAIFGIYIFLWALVSCAWDSVRLSTSDGFCSLSEEGVVYGAAVYRARGEMSAYGYDDFVSLRFQRGNSFGISVGTDFPLPGHGEMKAEEELDLCSRLKTVVCEGLYERTCSICEPEVNDRLDAELTEEKEPEEPVLQEANDNQEIPAQEVNPAVEEIAGAETAEAGVLPDRTEPEDENEESVRSELSAEEILDGLRAEKLTRDSAGEDCGRVLDDLMEEFSEEAKPL